MLTKLTGLSGQSFMNDEVDKLTIEVTEKRFIQAAITLCAVVMPITAVIAPNQPQGMKLAELGLGGVLGFASAYVSRSREEIEARYLSTITLNREVYKKEAINRFGKEQFMSDVTRDFSTVKALIGNLPNVQTAVEYAQRMNIPVGYFQEFLPTPASEQTENNQVRQLKQIGVATPNKDILDLHVNKTASAVIRSLAARYPDYIKIDGRWILELIESSSEQNMSKRANHHFMIVAETQAGKSTIAGVIARGIAQRSQAPAVIAGHDAKKKPGKKDITRWLCDFTPGYKIDGYENTEKWVNLSNSLASEQLDLVSEGGGGCEGVRELILIQDEHNTVYGKGNGYGKFIDSNLAKDLQAEWLFTTTNLAGAKGHGFFMGQSPLAGDTGFSLPAMNNCCFIAMGETSGYILEPKNKANYLRNISDDIVKILSQTCEMFQKEGLRYALVRPTRGNPYVAIIPEFDLDAILNSKNNIDVLEDGEKTQPENQETQQSNSYTEISADTTETFVSPWDTTPSPASNSKPDIQEVYKRMQSWIITCQQQLGKTPTREHIRQAWLQESGQTLSDEALDYILEKLGLR